MRLQPIVEGHGEVDAAPVLLRRLSNEAEQYQLKVLSGIRASRTQLANSQGLAKALQTAQRSGCDAILVLIDADDDCPAVLAPKITEWAEEASAGIPCVTVMAHREFEAWFLASIEPLRGQRGIRDDAESHPDPEQPRDAKRALKNRMIPGRGYSETTDQAAFAAKFSMPDAYSKCRSFRKFVKAFGDLMEAAGEPLADWPPASLTSKR